MIAPAGPLNRLIFGGDVMLSRWVWRIAAEKNDPAWPFRRIAADFARADIAFVNLESPFASSGPYFQDRMVFRTHSAMAEGLALAGIDVVSTANNHVRDAAGHGIEETLRVLDLHGIAASGTGRTAAEARQGAILERNGVRFGFVSFTFDQRNGNHPDDDPRVAMLGADTVREGVECMLPRADAVIVSMHAGWEYQPQPNTLQRAMARAAIDAGASMVIGHHPHVVQPLEMYQDKPIFYSLGNLVFDQFRRADTQLGLVVEAEFAGGRLIGLRRREVSIERTAPRFIVPAAR
jgi:poly-gamma-glutamate synthesis protein (capsule biosynthesis protein)